MPPPIAEAAAFCFVLFSHYIAQNVMGLNRLGLQRPTCLHVLSAGIKGVSQHTQLKLWSYVGWPQTHRDLLAFVSWVLGLKVCSIMPSQKITPLKGWTNPGKLQGGCFMSHLWVSSWVSHYGLEMFLGRGAGNWGREVLLV